MNCLDHTNNRRPKRPRVEAVCTSSATPLDPLTPSLKLKDSTRIYNFGYRKKPAELFRKDLISAMKMADSEQLNESDYITITDHWKEEWEKGVQVPVNPEGLPSASFRLSHDRTQRTPRDSTATQSSTHIKLEPGSQENGNNKQSSTKHNKSAKEYIKKSQTPNEFLKYEMDLIDICWQKLMAQTCLPKISENMIEDVITELERQCAENMKNNKIGIEFNDGVVCDVCRSPYSEDGNEMIFCDTCNVCVHQACYDIDEIPAGEWYCQPCRELGRVDKACCVLCPNKNGAMKRTPDDHWAHVSCSLWVVSQIDGDHKDDATRLKPGTDEHGIKIQMAAHANKMTSQEFCDMNAAKFFDTFKQYDTTVTDFIRTTEERHKRAVQFMWNQLDSNGYIYKSTYSGWYCTSDETFVPATQVNSKLVDGQTIHVDQNDNIVIWSSEDNYMFRMSQFESDLKTWLQSEKPVVPEKFNDMVLKTLEQSSIGDISVSRPKARLEWGIDVPRDPTQKIYVWLDALTSYLTVAGYPCHEDKLRRWPIDCQVLGKDIIKFHAIYWPAFLMALSLPLPRKLFCHSHWTLDSFKMSKSKGNVIEPSRESALLTEEGLRYYLLRASTNHSDTDYSREQALRRVNAELADTYGNLMSRCCARAINPAQLIPKSLIKMDNMGPFQELLDELERVAPVCQDHYNVADFYKGIDHIMSVLRLNNKVYEETKPWKLVKTITNDPESFRVYHNLQAITFETLRICSILLQPVVPKLAGRALTCMEVQSRCWKDARVRLEFGDPNNHVELTKSSNPVLFKRIK